MAEVPDSPKACNSGLPAIDSALARRIVENAIRRYFRARRKRIAAVVDETFSLTGAVDLHAGALGHDLWRAPLNMVMAGPQLALTLAADALEKLEVDEFGLDELDRLRPACVGAGDEHALEPHVALGGPGGPARRRRARRDAPGPDSPGSRRSRSPPSFAIPTSWSSAAPSSV